MLLATLALAAAGCAATGAKRTEVVTKPAGAVVRVEGFGECLSPCVIELDAARNVTIAKAGYKAQNIVIRPDGRRVVVELELAAPTTDVEESEIPEL
jgi:hypothetical protein